MIESLNISKKDSAHVIGGRKVQSNSYLSQIDIFYGKPQVFFNKQDRLQTSVGGCFSLLIIIFSLSIILFGLDDVVDRRKDGIQSVIEPYKSSEQSRDYTSWKLFPYFVLTNKTNGKHVHYREIQDLITIEANQLETFHVKKPDGYIEKTVYDRQSYDVKLCDGYEDKTKIAHYKEIDAQCLPFDKNLSLGGNHLKSEKDKDKGNEQEVFKYQRVEFAIKKNCKDQQSCKRIEDIIIWPQFTRRKVQIRNYENPTVRDYFSSQRYAVMDLSLNQVFEVKLQQTIMKTQDQRFNPFAQKQTHEEFLNPVEFYKNTRKREKSYHYDENTIYTMMFTLADNQLTYERSAYTLKELLGLSGGSISIVMVVVRGFMGWYSRLTMKLDLLQNIFFVKQKNSTLRSDEDGKLGQILKRQNTLGCKDRNLKAVAFTYSQFMQILVLAPVPFFKCCFPTNLRRLYDRGMERAAKVNSVDRMIREMRELRHHYKESISKEDYIKNQSKSNLGIIDLDLSTDEYENGVSDLHIDDEVKKVTKKQSQTSDLQLSDNFGNSQKLNTQQVQLEDVELQQTQLNGHSEGNGNQIDTERGMLDDNILNQIKYGNNSQISNGSKKNGIQ